MGVGRFVCVLLPFALTVASLIAMLVAGLGGVANKNQDLLMFSVNTSNLSLSANSVEHLLNSLTSRNLFETLAERDPATSHNTDSIPTDTSDATKAATDLLNSNYTAEQLGFYDEYRVGLWGYCWTAHNGTKDCSKPQFNWAEKAVDNSSIKGNTFVTPLNYNVTLPDGVTDAMKAFETVARWAEILFIIAVALLGLELFVGIFASCTRVASCITWIVALAATVFVCAAAALTTAMSVIVVGTIESTAKWYGVKASFNTSFLAAVWIGAAFAIAAGFFWMFTICCCAPDHSARSGRTWKRNRGYGDDGEKLVPTGAYHPVQHDPYNTQGSYSNGPTAYGANGTTRGNAYEPYASHANV